MTRTIKTHFHSLEPELLEAFKKSITIFYNTPDGKKPVIIDSLDEKINFILDFRNSFSHGFVTKYSIPTESEAVDMKITEYSSARFMTHQKIDADGGFKTIITSHLVGTMKLIVIHSLWNWIRSQHVI